MRWSKIKNIILIILATVNLFLLALVGVQAWRTAQNDRLARARMIGVLENNGITFEPEELPEDMDLTVQKLTLSAFGEAEAEKLLGTLTQTEILGSRVSYQGARGNLTISAKGEAVWELAPDVPLTEADIWAELHELGISFQEKERVREGSTETVTACLLWEEAPLPDEELQLTLVAGIPKSLSFRMLRGTAEEIAAETPITAATALLRLLDTLNQQGYICSRISDLYAGYALMGESVLTLEPMWFVEIDTAPWRLAVDAITGTVSVE